jgi:Uncharacterized protein conserved in bacteria
VFGDKFYKKLHKLMPWQQTVFALALSERMYPNYCLYAESTGRGDTKLIRHALDTMWQYLTEKSMRIDLSAILEQIESNMPEPQSEECYGAWPALDACVALATAYNSVVFRLGDEAYDVSQTSLGSVVGFIEMQQEKELSAEELYAEPLIEDEMAFQVELLAQVSRPRDAEVIWNIKTLATGNGISNLGIALD